MPLAAEHDLSIDGQQVLFHSRVGDSRILQPNDFIDVVGDLVGGEITISAESLDFASPTFIRVLGNPRDPDREEQTIYNSVPVRVELFAEGADEPTATWTTKAGQQPEGEQESVFRADAGPIDRLRHRRWRLRVTNTSNKVVIAVGGMKFVRDQDFVGQTRVPLRVLNHAFDVVLSALAPRARIANGVAHISFGAEIAQTLGMHGDHPFGNRTVRVDLPVNVTGHLVSVDVEACSGATLLGAVEERWQATKERLEAQLQMASGVEEHRVRAALEANDEWKTRWMAAVAPSRVAVHITALASTIDLEGSWIPGFDFDLGSIENLAIHVYIAFVRGGVAAAARVLVLAPAEVTGAVGVGVDLGLLPKPEEFAERLMRPALEQYSPIIHRYLAEVFARLSPFLGSLPTIFLDAEGEPESILVRWTSDPADQRATVAPTSPPPSDGRPRPPGLSPGALRPSISDVRMPPEAPPDRGPRGQVPAEFELGDPASLTRLSRIDTLVFVMLENRSFDHLLGFLRQVNPQYHGFTGNERNSYVEHGFIKTVRMRPATHVVLPPVTQILADPHHSTPHVLAQIAEGAMSGFAADMLDRGEPQLALTYYARQQLPNTYRLAERFLVCDHWFAAHPGGTYPNRWATLGGSMPELENVDVDDPRVGFFSDRTIFDLLTQQGIGWHYYENNVSIIRMYGRYRLDDTNVLPYDDPIDGFEAKARKGSLPPVVFVEPRFTGIPPLYQASDDHPPADLRVGQQFIGRVYKALADSPQWGGTLLLITYDEHGGFFDHVPPPGTALGPPEWRGKVPRIHPNGADFMGARVPALVVSPFVTAGTVSHAVFDHTSIIKTILVKHRARFFADQFRLFGPRVPMINHLGAALNRDTPQPDLPPLLSAPGLQRPAVGPAGQAERPRGPMELPPHGDRRDFHVSLARAMLPRRW